MKTTQLQVEPKTIDGAILGEIAVTEYYLIKTAIDLETQAKGLRTLANNLFAIRDKQNKQALNREDHPVTG